MFVIMAYDINEKRVAKVRKIALKYLLPIQKSLFQGYLTDKQLKKLQNELQRVISLEEDKIIFYKTFDISTLEIDEIGLANDLEMIL